MRRVNAAFWAGRVHRRLTCAGLVLVFAVQGGCIGELDEITLPDCGLEVLSYQGVCVPTALPEVCGAGTVADPQSGRCVSTLDSGVRCGPGTVREGRACVATPAACGPGEVWHEGACQAQLVCGEGTERWAGRCVSHCAPGALRGPAGDCVLEGYVHIPAGSFLMGSEPNEAGRAENEGPQHVVELNHAFWMKATPVTTGEWYEMVGNQPSAAARTCGDDCPVEHVNWYEALAYLNALSEFQGLQPCYWLEGCEGILGGRDDESTYRCGLVSRDVRCEGYRLPTEAEWEYAYRAGTQGAYYAEPVEAIAWFAAEEADAGELPEALDDAGVALDLGADAQAPADAYVEPPGIHRVAQKQPNAWGLYDMAGNVWEWCWDGYREDYYAQSPTRDPQGASRPTHRVTRGGDAHSPRESMRAAHRGEGHELLTRDPHLGLRPVRSAPSRP